MQFAAWPVWMTFVLVMMVVGPTLRMIFNRIDPYSRRGRWRFQPPEDSGRLDAALAERDNVIEDLQRRLNEMESRLDFTERMLTERSSTQPADPMTTPTA